MLSTRIDEYAPGYPSLYASTPSERTGMGARAASSAAHSVGMLVPRAALPCGKRPVRK